MSERAVEPLRGEVWDARIPVAGSHPVVILTINPMISRLSSVTVAVITGTPGRGAHAHPGGFRGRSDP